MSVIGHPNLRRWAEKLLCKRFWVSGENRIW